MTRPEAPLDLSRPGRYHVVGVGGPGMSAIALTLAEMGHDDSGSDVREVSVLDRCAPLASPSTSATTGTTSRASTP